jgi:hypothetical protein
LERALGAYEYAELIDRVLSTCEYLDPRPVRPTKIEIPANNPSSFYWKEKFTFRDGKILSVTDMATFDTDGEMVERKFMYDFRDDASHVLLFRICNHGAWQLVSKPCHVHVEREENTVEFPSSEGKDFTYALHCIKNFYQQKSQDWEKEDGNGPNA